MPFNVLLLPLIGGYLFIHFTHYTRYRAHTLSSYRLILESALAGAIFFFGARVSIVVVEWAAYGCPILALVVPRIEALWALVVPTEHLGAGAIALVLGPLGSWITNEFVYDLDASAGATITRYGDDLLQLLYEASLSEAWVMLTLGTGKVYVGGVVLSAHLRHDNRYIVILPIRSGRRTEKLNVELTTDYGRVYAAIEGNDPEFAELDYRDFLLVLPISTIVSATPFVDRIPGDFSLAGEVNGGEDSSSGE